jgi:hypothetical protein
VLGALNYNIRTFLAVIFLSNTQENRVSLY